MRCAPNVRSATSRQKTMRPRGLRIFASNCLATPRRPSQIETPKLPGIFDGIPDVPIDLLGAKNIENLGRLGPPPKPTAKADGVAGKECSCRVTACAVRPIASRGNECVGYRRSHFAPASAVAGPAVKQQRQPAARLLLPSRGRQPSGAGPAPPADQAFQVPPEGSSKGSSLKSPGSVPMPGNAPPPSGSQPVGRGNKPTSTE